MVNILVGSALDTLLEAYVEAEQAILQLGAHLGLSEQQIRNVIDDRRINAHPNPLPGLPAPQARHPHEARPVWLNDELAGIIVALIDMNTGLLVRFIRFGDLFPRR